MEAVKLCKQFQRKDYSGQDTVKTFEMFFKEQRVTPGDILRFKESSNEYRFVSLETVLSTGTTWINVRDLNDSFKVKSYHPSKVKSLVRKRSFSGKG